MSDQLRAGEDRATDDVPEMAARPERRRGGVRGWIIGFAPLVLLALVIGGFFFLDPVASLREGIPPVEELTVTRVELNERPHEIVLHVRNGGPEPVTVAQVLVDDAYWDHEITPSRTIDRLGAATIRLPYPWVDGEAHEVLMISSTGVTFSEEIAVAIPTPDADAGLLAILALVGIFVGVIPVALGLLWHPFVRRLSPAWVGFFLALTIGLLVFLAVDALDEALEIAGDVPGAFQGIGLIVVGIVGALGALLALDGRLRRRRGGSVSPFTVAMLIAVGIGLHNLGEGLAIGAAYAIGEIGLTAFLILGFMLHNVTEGLGIVTPLAESKVRISAFVALGAVAGLPTIAGTWLGALAFSPTLAVLFLSIGVGAILQVVWEVGKLMRRAGPLTAPLNAGGFVAGIVVMYGTGLLVAA